MQPQLRITCYLFGLTPNVITNDQINCLTVLEQIRFNDLARVVQTPLFMALTALYSIEPTVILYRETQTSINWQTTINIRTFSIHEVSISTLYIHACAKLKSN